MTSLGPNNEYLTERSFKIRSKTIPWEGYQRAGLLSVEEVGLISRVANQKTTAPILATEGSIYSELYVTLLNKLSRNDTLQFILVLIAEMIDLNEESITLLLKAGVTNPLIKLLDSPDDYIKLKTCALLSLLVTTQQSPVPKLITTLAALLRNVNDTAGQDIAVQSFQLLLTLHEIRLSIYGNPESTVIDSLIRLVNDAASAQMQYQLGFCFWLLTFEEQIGKNINQKHGLIPILLDLTKSAKKEKVVRISIAAIRNLITVSSTNTSPLLAFKGLDLINSLLARNWSDEEIVEDLTFVKESLVGALASLTTFDQYVGELKSGKLVWSPTHESEEFWKENGDKFLEKGGEVLKLLVELLKKSEEQVTLAVCANDLSQLIRVSPKSKKMMEELSIRGKIMELMLHPNEEIKYRALVCVQRLVVSTPYA